MAEHQDPDITQLLRRISGGDRAAESELFAVCYSELRHLARSFISREKPGHTLQATALVNELYLKIAGAQRTFNDRVHFFCIAAVAMRQILTDHARRRNTARRGSGSCHMKLDEVFIATDENLADLLILDDALNRFAEFDSRGAKIVEMRVFAGLTEQEIGILLDVSPRTVRRDWDSARKWLQAELNAG